MTDNEIIKALGYCLEKLCYCKECPRFEKGNDNCHITLYNDTLNLINRQKEKLDLAKKTINALTKERMKQKAEIERLKDLNNVLEADIINANMILEHIQYEFDLLKQEKSVARADAVKEFAERLKKEVDVVYSIKHLQDIIDNLVKEFTEGD